MHITIERTHLAKAVAHVQSVTEKRNTIPILGNVLLEADQGQLRLTATDMDVSMIELAPCQVTVPGATTVPLAYSMRFWASCPMDLEVELALDAETGRLRLRAGRSDFSLATLPREDFPAVTTEAMPTEFQIKGADFGALIDKTRFAISKEGTRYYLTGIYLHAAEGAGGCGNRWPSPGQSRAGRPARRGEPGRHHHPRQNCGRNSQIDSMATAIWMWAFPPPKFRWPAAMCN